MTNSNNTLITCTLTQNYAVIVKQKQKTWSLIEPKPWDF